MSDQAWLRPEFGVVPTVLAAALIGYYFVASFRGRRRYRALEAARAAGDTGALERYLRAKLRNQVIVSVLVLGVVAVFGPARRAVGQALPAGPHVAASWGWTAYLCVGVLVGGLILRYRARRGLSVPGQKLFRALVPTDARQRRVGALTAIGAGVSEELAFRGLLTAAGVEWFGLGAVASSVLVSVVFGAAHAYQGWRGVLGTAVAGGVLSWLYLLSQSLLAPMIVHVVVDLRALVLVPLQRQDIRPREPRRSPAVTPARPHTPVDEIGPDDPPVLP